MADSTVQVTVREADKDTLDELAALDWRTPPQQASAMLAAALAAARARSAPGLQTPRVIVPRGRRPNAQPAPASAQD